MDFREARAGALGAGYLGGLGAVPRLTPAAYRTGIAWDQYTQAAAQQIFTDAYDTVDALGGIEPYASEGWRVAYMANGSAWSIGSILPFPTVAPWDFPMETTGPTPGEMVPLTQCERYKVDGQSAVNHFEAKYAALRDGDVIAAGVTKGAMRWNIKIDYNEEAQRHGCSTLPFPEAVGQVKTAESYPVPSSGPPGGGNVLIPDDGGPPIPLDPDGYPVDAMPPRPPTELPPPVIPPPLPRPLPPNPDDAPPVLTVDPGDVSIAPAAGPSLGILAAIGAALYLFTRKRS